jgi:hypothetical protein
MASTPTINAVPEKPIASFVISLIGGIIILVGSAAVVTLPRGEPYYGGMMGGYYYGGMMGGYYAMMHGFGFGGGWYYGLAATGIASGFVVLVGAIMVYNQPAKASTWGALILVFSVVSFFGMGGFFVGAILGVVGGILALTWAPTALRAAAFRGPDSLSSRATRLSGNRPNQRGSPASRSGMRDIDGLARR